MLMITMAMMTIGVGRADGDVNGGAEEKPKGW